jgi:hypothetical protein
MRDTYANKTLPEVASDLKTKGFIHNRTYNAIAHDSFMERTLFYQVMANPRQLYKLKNFGRKSMCDFLDGLRKVESCLPIDFVEQAISRLTVETAPVFTSGRKWNPDTKAIIETAYGLYTVCKNSGQTLKLQPIRVDVKIAHLDPL